MKRFFFLVVFFSFLLFSCKNEDDSPSSEPLKSIFVAYPANSLGDRAYFDSISLALNKAAIKNSMQISEISVENDKDADIITFFLLLSASEENSFCIFTSSYFIPFIFAEDNQELLNSVKSSILVIEADETTSPFICTQKVHFYGVSYEAGVLTDSLISEDEYCDIIIADPELQTLKDATQGFKEGFESENRVGKINLIPLNQLAPDSPFSPHLSDTLYIIYKIALIGKIQETFPSIIFPLCGGLTHGLLRINREYEENSFYTIGISVDMSPYSKMVPFSVVKNMDKILMESVEQWNKNSLPHHKEFGLEGDYTKIVIAKSYQETFQEKLNQIHEDAIQKEKEYYEKK